MKNKSYSRQKQMKKGMLILTVLALAFIFCFPIYMALLTSFKSQSEISQSILSIPSGLWFENYKEALEKSDFARSLFNSCIVTFPSVVLIVLCASMGGYAIARYGGRNKGFQILDKIYLGSLMIPFQILMIPIYKVFKELRLQNSLLGMILLLTGTSIAYATFLYVGFVKSIPRDLEDAAMIDGCGPYRTFFKIVFPLMKPVTATVAALHVMWLWNDFNIALIVLQKEEVRTLTVKQYYFFGEHTADYGIAFSASIICMLPVLLFFIFSQRYLVEGIASGAVKS